jgi:cyclase
MINYRRISPAGRLAAVTGILAASMTVAGLAQERDFSAVEIKAHEVKNGIWYLEGSGGQIGLSVGEDGIFMIDDQFAPLTDKIVAAIREISDEEIRFLINTHVHGDHAGGNENLANQGVLIFAHDHVRARLIDPAPNRDTGAPTPPAPKAALPVVTYSEDLALYINGETIRAVSLPPGHTDGDSIIYFVDSNIVHMGDAARTTSYPYIDKSNGGSFLGNLEGIQIAIDLIDDDTIVIPGHGAPADRAALVAILGMLEDIRDNVKALKDGGKSVEEVIAAKPTADYDERWGDTGFFTKESFIELIYSEL